MTAAAAVTGAGAGTTGGGLSAVTAAAAVTGAGAGTTGGDVSAVMGPGDSTSSDGSSGTAAVMAAAKHILSEISSRAAPPTWSELVARFPELLSSTETVGGSADDANIAASKAADDMEDVESAEGSASSSTGSDISNHQVNALLSVRSLHSLPSADDPVGSIVKPEVQQTYGTAVSRALCQLLLADMRACDSRCKRELAQLQVSDHVMHMGRFMAIYNPLRSYDAILLPTGPVACYLTRYCLVTAVLCYFHVQQALERKGKEVISDGDARKAALRAFRAVIDADDAAAADAAWVAYQQEWSAYQEWLDYLRKEWVKPTGSCACSCISAIAPSTST